MKAWKTLVLLQEPRWRRRAGSLLPLVGVVLLHLLLVAMIVSWKPPAMGRAPRATELSFVSAEGEAAAPQFVTPPITSQTTPKSTTAPPIIALESSPDLGAGSLSTPKLAIDPPKTLEPIQTSIVAGGPSLTAEPQSVAAQPPASKPVALATAGGKGCQILENLQASLQNSAEVKTALTLIPAASRSISNAILLWDGRWIDMPTTGGSAALTSIERITIQNVAQAPPTCQTETVHGPRLITLGDARDTMVLAFGSGDWRWADLLATVSPITAN